MNKSDIGSEPDIAVRLRGLRKVYKLYRNASYRLRDIMGLLPSDKQYYNEHVALHDVTLDVRRGEKVAIIGRNGAGKSTLLRLITKVIEPTSGTIDVRGDTQALLSLGTGFHPEFTGRENVRAYLANFGIAGENAERMIRQVIEFAELEEYIDQPTKTYSSGMGMRLMFAASTMFVPDLLVIDEVLGVGDAYFQSKSFERIREICTSNGTTLLLVTHDIYTASTLCDRMIWIDNGAVLLDADSPTVLKAYDASIRQQEEARLRKKALLNLEKLAESAREQLTPLIVELRSPDNTAAAAPVAIGKVALLDGEREVASVPLTEDFENSDPPAQIVLEGGAWGDPIMYKERPARQMNNFGSSLHKVAVSFLLPPYLAERSRELTLAVEAACNDHFELEAWRVDADLRASSLGLLSNTPGEWQNFRLPLSGSEAVALEAKRSETMVRAAETHGSGRVTVSSLRVLDEHGHETVQLEHGRPATMLVGYTVNDASLDEHCQIVLVFRRNGVDDVFRLFCNQLRFQGGTRPEGEVAAYLPRVPLGAGEYSITVMIAAERYFDERPTIFYSINPKVYWARRGLAEIKIYTDEVIPSGTAVVGEADWYLRPALEKLELSLS